MQYDFWARLDYVVSTGRLYWKTPHSAFVKVGDEFGHFDPTNGYRSGIIFGRKFYTHRIVWMMHNGPIKRGHYIDHINGDRHDNRIENLRPVSPTVSSQNRGMQSNNKSGVTGVYFSTQRRKWHAEIWVNGRKKHLGFFDNLDSAASAYKEGKKRYGFTHRHGQPLAA